MKARIFDLLQLILSLNLMSRAFGAAAQEPASILPSTQWKSMSGGGTQGQAVNSHALRNAAEAQRYIPV